MLRMDRLLAAPPDRILVFIDVLTSLKGS